GGGGAKNDTSLMKVASSSSARFAGPALIVSSRGGDGTGDGRARAGRELRIPVRSIAELQDRLRERVGQALIQERALIEQNEADSGQQAHDASFLTSSQRSGGRGSGLKHRRKKQGS
ncbi:unnamed protein product, partial [Amoebophrya sp. A25]